jgi:hypothetical protein
MAVQLRLTRQADNVCRGLYKSSQAPPRISFAKQSLLQDLNRLFYKINKEAKVRRSTRSLIIGTAKVMKWEDLERVRAERVAKDKDAGIRAKQSVVVSARCLLEKQMAMLGAKSKARSMRKSGVVRPYLEGQEEDQEGPRPATEAVVGAGGLEGTSGTEVLMEQYNLGRSCQFTVLTCFKLILLQHGQQWDDDILLTGVSPSIRLIATA